jgi:signal transduction histidine kinase
MSEMQTGSYEPKFTEQTIARDLSALIPEFKALAQLKNIDLVFSDRSYNSEAYIDNYTVTQIFANLIDNAIKFTDTGKIEITLYNSPDGAVCVDVSDTGIGIAPEYFDDLFTPFSQEDTGYTRRFEGNGLGLALVKKYCDLNNSEMKIKSEKNAGSVFTVVFNNVQKIKSGTLKYN